MKRILFSLLTFSILNFSSEAQNGGACNVFSDGTGLSEWDPNNKVSYSVSGGELTITFTDADFWGQNEVKWDFPSPIDISGSGTTTVSYDIAVTSVTINGGSGAGCSSINYLPLGIAVYDGTNYSTGAATTGYYDANYVSGSVNVTISPATATAVTGVSIKPASFNDGSAPCNTDGGSGGSGTVTATIKIKNLKVGTASCGTTNVKNVAALIADSKIYPNPSDEVSVVSLNLKSSSHVKVILSDLMGREIRTVAEGNYTEMREEVNAKDLKAGTYTVSFIIDGAFAKSQIFIVK